MPAGINLILIKNFEPEEYLQGYKIFYESIETGAFDLHGSMGETEANRQFCKIVIRSRLTPAIYPWLLLIPALLFGGCTATIQPPNNAAGNGRIVFLLDHGFHCGLVMTRADGSLVRYVYGEWRWFAKRETGIARVFPTLLRPTTAALGRKQLAGPPTEMNVRGRIPVVIKKLHRLIADPARVDTLIEKLDQQFEDGRDTMHYNTAYDLKFVEHPEPYRLGNNSNHVVRGWLRELGFTVRGNPVLGYWRVKRQSSVPETL